MKNPRIPRFSIRIFFSLFVSVVWLIVIAVVAGLMVLFDQFFHVSNKIPSVLWMVIMSTVIGSALTTFLSKYIFDPVLKLGEAMQKVAHGDFNATFNANRSFREIRQIEQDFNLMTNELRSTEILKTEFISNVSHEFKTPINAIEGYATLLQGTDFSNKEEQQEYIDKILFNTNRLSKLVGNILLLSKVDNQGIQTKIKTYRLDEQIRQSILSLEPLWLKNENEFDVDLDAIEYTGNENLFMHVWTNLIENAIKYSPIQSLISIKLTQENNKILFTIDDEGTGIPEESMQHIFDRFYQADTSRKSEGNGLGLALVKQIVTISNGDISVSNLPGKGCRFTVQLNCN